MKKIYITMLINFIFSFFIVECLIAQQTANKIDNLDFPNDEFNELEKEIVIYTSPDALFKQNLVPDFRVNEQIGNSAKNDIKSVLNDNNISIVVWSDIREGSSNVYAQLFTSSGEKVGENIKVNFPNGGQIFYQPDVAVNSDNNFLVIWTDVRSGYEIYGQLLDEQGNFINENFKICDENKRSTKLYPSISSNGNQFLVTWSDRRNGSLYDIYAQRLNKDGTKINQNFIVNSDTQSVSLYSSSPVLDKEGNIGVSWRQYVNGSNSTYFISRDINNDLISTQVKVNDETTESSSIGIAVLTKSKIGYFAVWHRYLNNNYDVIGQFINSTGQKNGSNFIVNDEEQSTQLYPHASSDSSGNIVATWYDYRNGFIQIYAQRFINETPVDSNFKVTEDELIGSKIVIANSVNNSGNFVTSWLDYSEPTKNNVYARHIDQNNSPLTSSTRLDNDEESSKQTEPKIAVFQDGSYVIAWSDYRFRTSRAYFQIYDKNGNPLGENIAVANSGRQFSPNIINNADGTFIILWGEYYRATFNQYEVFAQKYDNNGEKIGEKFLVSSKEIQGSTRFMDGAANSKGEFVVTWERRVGNIYRIYAQKYDSLSNNIGDNFLVAVDTTSNNLKPKVGIDPNGNFVITYYGYDKNNYEIFLNRYNNNAEKIGETIIVNDDVVKTNQFVPAISINENGDCVVAWFDYRNNSGIYFQKFKTNGNDNTFERVDTNKAVADYVMAYSTPSISIDKNGKFVISWNEKTSNFNDIKFRVYNSDNTPLTEIIYATESQERNQLNQDIVFANNKIYNVWQDNHEPSVGYDIWANIFDINDLITNVDDKNTQVLTSYELKQNYPNPFNPGTTISFSLPNAENVRLTIYNILGQKVAALLNEFKNAGNYKVNWDASKLSSGIYIYRLEAGAKLLTKRMMLLK